MKKNVPLICVLLFLWAVPNHVLAQLETTGFIRNYNAIQLRPDHNILIGRNRLRLNLSKDFSRGTIFISNDLRNLYSTSADSLNYRLRQAYIDLYFPKAI